MKSSSIKMRQYNPITLPLFIKEASLSSIIIKIIYIYRDVCACN